MSAPQPPVWRAARVENLPEAAIIKMASRSRELTAQGHDVVNLTVGQPDFETPGPIKEAAKKALDQGHTKYTPVPGLPALRSAIADKLAQENDIETTPECIVVSNGAKQSIFNVCMALLDPGDEVIVTAPYWASYIGLIALAQGTPVIVPAGVDEDFKVPAQRLEAAITERTRLIMLNSPANPTGAVHSRAELGAIAEMLARQPQIFVLSDEIYEYINFTGGHTSLAAFGAVKERVITVNGLSKGFAMTGWRIGYMAGEKWLADACIKIQSNVTSGANSFAQHAACTALAGPRDSVTAMVDAYRARRDLVTGRLAEMDKFRVSVPDGTFYVFPDISDLFGASAGGQTIDNAEKLCDFLLERHHLACVPGTAFGEANCIRLSFAAAREQLDAGLDRLSAAVAELT